MAVSAAKTLHRLLSGKSDAAIEQGQAVSVKQVRAVIFET